MKILGSLCADQRTFSASKTDTTSTPELAVSQNNLLQADVNFAIMSEKRKRDRDEGGMERKKQKRGFVVGPANLPDGTYKRKSMRKPGTTARLSLSDDCTDQKIKQNLIDKAKLKKEYAKLKKQGKVPDEEEALPKPASMAADAGLDEEASEDEKESQEPVSTEPHPDRQNLIDEEEEAPAEQRRPRQRRPKAVPFKKEHEQAQKRKAEAEERRRAREEAERERQRKIEERDKFRRAMAKARTGGKNGQRKLGRESQPLLEKVKRLVAEK